MRFKTKRQRDVSQTLTWNDGFGWSGQAINWRGNCVCTIGFFVLVSPSDRHFPPSPEMIFWHLESTWPARVVLGWQHSAKSQALAIAKVTPFWGGEKNQWNFFDFLWFYIIILKNGFLVTAKNTGTFWYKLPCFLILDKSLDLEKDGLCGLNLECKMSRKTL